MRDRWMALELGQRQLVAGLLAAVLVLGLVVGAVILAGGGGSDHQKVDTAAGSSTTTTTERSSTTAAGDEATGSTAPGSSTTAADGSSTTTTTTAVKGTHKATSGSGSTRTTTVKVGVAVTTTIPATTTSPSAAAGRCSTGGSGQDDQIANLFCAYRSDQGLAPMSRNSALDGVAQRWAAKMAKDADAAVAAGQDPAVALAHNLSSDPEATYPGGYSAAVKSDCSQCTGWAENVAYNSSASAAWSGWLGSSAHLEDIRGGPDGGEYGVGAVQGGGYWWYVQDFGYYP